MNIVKNIKEKSLHDVSVNIWDDFYDDGYAPDGEIVETFVYIDDTIFSFDERTEFLEYIKEIIDSYKFPIQTKMSIYDTKIKYPNLDFEELQMEHWRRPEIRLYNITHDIREKILDKLNVSDLSFKNKNFRIYSSS